MVEKFIPGRQFKRIRDRKEGFDEINALVTAKGGWVTSIPGAPEVHFECLPGATLPEELREAGHEVSETGEGERILPGAIIEAVLIEGSTVPIAVRHAGIVRVLCFSF
ncbi:hypothetical protein [Bradyrhizobium symbiodeficiens]|uniref:hypothetical protein n=1 Tax=Bradyrhizobium symbiodeficiens TaxID=1404367 RepID=UPI000BA1AACE|nr:hypothetical protein [Bradyrhizobium symbiodeficiens]AWM07623.1 hypothetical protein CIT39_14995 [Bradyrhizobium symbiodeficiens]